MQLCLICQDDDELALLSVALQHASVSIMSAHDVAEALLLWRNTPSDMIVLVQSGEAPVVCVQRLRAVTTVPLVLLMDPVREDEHIALLDAGVDLVFFRPYSMRLLLNQIPALLRRTSGVPLAAFPPLTQSDVRLEPETRVVEVDGHPPRQLSHREFRLLYALMSAPGRIFSLDDLVERVWGYEEEGDRNLVRKLVRRLRLKVEPDASAPRYIVSVPGLGYMYCERDAGSKGDDPVDTNPPSPR